MNKAINLAKQLVNDGYLEIHRAEDEKSILIILKHKDDDKCAIIQHDVKEEREPDFVLLDSDVMDIILREFCSD